MQCRRCKHYEPTEGVSIEGSAVGYCHRYPPVMTKTAAGTATDFPIVGASMWCGEYKPAPGKTSGNVVPIQPEKPLRAGH